MLGLPPTPPHFCRLWVVHAIYVVLKTQLCVPLALCFCSSFHSSLVFSLDVPGIVAWHPLVCPHDSTPFWHFSCFCTERETAGSTHHNFHVSCSTRVALDFSVFSNGVRLSLRTTPRRLTVSTFPVAWHVLSLSWHVVCVWL